MVGRRSDNLDLVRPEASNRWSRSVVSRAVQYALERTNVVLRSRELLIALVAIGATIRILQYVSNRSLWLDESLLALNLLDKSFGGLFGQLEFSQGAPPGFLVAERLVASAFGYSEFALRLLPLLAGLAALIAFVSLARRVLQPVAVPVAVGVFALSNGLVYYSSELKPYSFDVAATVVILLAGVSLAGNPRSRGAAVAFAGALTALAFSFAAVFAAASAVLSLVVSAVRGRTVSRSLVIALAVWLAGTAALVVFVLARLTAVRHAFSLSSTGAVDSPGSTLSLLNVFGTNIATATGFLQSTPWVQLEKLGVAVVAVGAVRLVIRRRLLGSIVLLPLVLSAVAAALHLYPVAERTLLFLVPVVALLLAEGITTLADPSRSRAFALFAVLTVALFIGPVWLAAKGAVQPRKHEEIKPALAYIRDQWRAGDVLYLNYATQYAFLYYMRCSCFSADAPDGRPLWPVAPGDGGVQEFAPAVRPLSASLVIAPKVENVETSVADLDRLRGRRRVWFLYSHVSNDTERQVITDGILGRLDSMGRRVLEYSEVGAHAYLYSLDR
jgi:uncharacterized membrane protein